MKTQIAGHDVKNQNTGTFMNHDEGVSWDRCRFYPGMKEPTSADFDRVNAVKARAGDGGIFYKSGLPVQAIQTDDNGE